MYGLPHFERIFGAERRCGKTSSMGNLELRLHFSSRGFTFRRRLLVPVDKPSISARTVAAT